MTALDKLGARLQAQRETKGWSRRRLATEVGLATSYIALIETGERRPSLETMVLLAAIMGLPAHALLVDDDGVHPDDSPKIVPVEGAVFDRGRLRMVGTNVRVSDVVARFAAGDCIADLARDWEVEPATVEAALRTALRAGRPDP